MGEFLFLLLCILVPTAILLGGVKYLIYRKKILAAKVVISIGLAIPFLYLGSAALMVLNWGGGGPRHYRPGGSSFIITNSSSLPLHVDASFAYTPSELDHMRQSNIEVSPEVNFLTYRNAYIRNRVNTSDNWNQFYFDTPILTDSSAGWPSEFYIVLSDTLGKEMLRLAGQSLDSIVRHTMHLEVTDSLLRLVTSSKVVIEPNMNEGGMK